MNKTYLLLGSNMGDSKAQLAYATKQIDKVVGKVTRYSSLYQTKAWGNTAQADFINQVIVVENSFTAEQTLDNVLTIEKEMGRTRNIKNEPRIIDIDILFFGKQVIHTPNLVIPHPAIHLRRFVLVPLNELSPLFVHPSLQKNIHQLLLECPDPLDVNKI